MTTRDAVLRASVVFVASFFVAPAAAWAQTKACAQPVTTGAKPTASDCLFILKTAVGSVTCDPACVCAPKGTVPTTATDALICLRSAVGQPVTLNCPCVVTTTTSVTLATISTTTTTATTTSSSTTTTLPGQTTTTVPGQTTTTVTGPTTTIGPTTTTTLAPICPSAMTAAAGGANLIEPSFVNEVLTFVKNVRDNVTPAAAPPLSDVCYDPALQSLAETAASTCQCELQAAVDGLRESMLCAKDSQSLSTMLGAMSAQGGSYDYVSATCSSVTCDDWCQLIARVTATVGCALQNCPDNYPFGGGPWTKLSCYWSEPAPCVPGTPPY